MTTTYVELKDRLKQFDEVLLLELLNISSEDLVERFSDIIEEQYDSLLSQID